MTFILIFALTHSQNPAPAKYPPAPDGSLTDTLHAVLNAGPGTSAVPTKPLVCVHRCPITDELDCPSTCDMGEGCLEALRASQHHLFVLLIILLVWYQLESRAPPGPLAHFWQRGKWMLVEVGGEKLGRGGWRDISNHSVWDRAGKLGEIRMAPLPMHFTLDATWIQTPLLFHTLQSPLCEGFQELMGRTLLEHLILVTDGWKP